MMLSHREWKIGTHTFRFEPPDLLWIDFKGALSMEDAARSVALYRELSTTQPMFVIGDLKDAEPLASEVSHYLSEQMRPEWFLATVYYGARLIHKALIKGIVLASQLTERVDKNSVTLIHYASTKEQAEEFIAQLRARHYSGTGSSAGD